MYTIFQLPYSVGRSRHPLRRGIRQQRLQPRPLDVGQIMTIKSHALVQASQYQLAASGQIPPKLRVDLGLRTVRASKLDRLGGQ
jgi:hypothetical protein